MRVEVLAASVAIAVSGLAAGAGPAPTPVPKATAKAILHVENETVDAGEVRPGSVLTGTFVFRNTGERPVRILKAAPS